MAVVFLLLTLLTLMALVVGIFKPRLVLLGGSRTRLRAAIIYGIASLSCFVLFVMVIPSNTRGTVSSERSHVLTAPGAALDAALPNQKLRITTAVHAAVIPKQERKPMPRDEADVIRIVTAAQQSDGSAENDMQRGAFKAQRDKALCSRLKPLAFNDWTGHVAEIDANSDGKGILAIVIADDITLKTWNNDFSDISDKTLIMPGTKLFNVAASLRQNQAVKISGTLIRGHNGDCFEEGRLTLAGKLRTPEFIVRFSAISLMQ
jgi:hypothetical protein